METIATAVVNQGASILKTQSENAFQNLKQRVLNRSGGEEGLQERILKNRERVLSNPYSSLRTSYEDAISPEVLDGVENIYRSIHKRIEPVLGPLLNTISNPETQKKVLNRLVFFCIFMIFLTGAVLLYTLFYNLYLPKYERESIIYFDYNLDGYKGVHGVLDLSMPPLGSEEKFFRYRERFDLKLDLKIPESDNNFAKGNFMVTTHLKDDQNKTIRSSKRPALVRHKSYLLRLISTFARSIFLVTGFGYEEQTVRVDLLENLFEDVKRNSDHLVIEMNDAGLQIYESNVVLRKKLFGLAFLMTDSFYLTGTLFVLIFMVVEAILAYVWWIGYSLRQKYLSKHRLVVVIPDNQAKPAPGNATEVKDTTTTTTENLSMNNTRSEIKEFFRPIPHETLTNK